MILVPKRALLSVSDKTGIVEFAKQLLDLNVEIISTGGTSRALHEAGISHRPVEDITGLSALLDGRVKTLHPKIHGGILGRRDVHAKEAAQHGIPWIDLVVVNFYPFTDVIQQKNTTWNEAIEHIDIGGPTLVRAAAKNLDWVGVVVDPQDYAPIVEALHHHGLDITFRKKLAQKAFAMTSHYDNVIHHYFVEQSQAKKICADQLNLHLEKCADLRYGENPHQQACAYRFANTSSILSAKQYQGKPLSYNNILDAEAASCCLQEFESPTAAIIKHGHPCGVASSVSIEEAFMRAYEADALSAFGGIVALNRSCTKEVAEKIATLFVEVMIAPAYDNDALIILAKKPNVRVLDYQRKQDDSWEMRGITGGLLLQEKDHHLIRPDDLKIVTRLQLTPEDQEALLFAWRVIKHVKSNAILIAKSNVTVGIGAGQVSRVDAVDIALRKAGEGCHDAVLASDAFFPFRDSIDRLAPTGLRAIIQPGGSLRDPEVIAACDEHGIAMVFTGKRCFRH